MTDTEGRDRTAIEGGWAMIETPEQLRREIAYRVDERIGIMTLGALPSKSVVEFAKNEAREWARRCYPELLDKSDESLNK